MAPVAGNKLSLSKHYKFRDLAEAIGELEAGMTEEEVREALPPGHPELADDLFLYSKAPDGVEGLVEDTLVSACQAQGAEASLLAWVALLYADDRLQRIVGELLTTPEGKLDPAKFSKEAVAAILEAEVGGASSGKDASNLLRWLETAGLAEGDRYGGSVVGLRRALPTSQAVPAATRLICERLEAYRQVTPGASAEAAADLAIGIGANHWLNLTPEEFRAAATRTGLPGAVASRPELPQHLGTIDSELRRKGQAVLQGPPGVGKTYAAERYLDWFTAGERAAGRVAELAAGLPAQEQTPGEVADRAMEEGRAGLWELVQFHPSYSYERFIRGLQATPVPGGVSFEVVDRTLAFLAALAGELEQRGSNIEVLLVIDEINRGDTAKIFGELLYALEYRGEPVSTPYELDGDRTLSLPRNLFLLGTMNTADQSIAMVDKALRRRFGWINLRPDPEVFSTYPGFAGEADRAAARRLFELTAEVFDDEDPEASRLQVGHSYFLPDGDPATEGEGLAQLARKFAFDCWPLLEEYRAEGLVELEALDALLGELGVTASSPDQAELEKAVLVWLGAPAAATAEP
jgi:5-methylcytosine-specific restriction protein B